MSVLPRDYKRVLTRITVFGKHRAIVLVDLKPPTRQPRKKMLQLWLTYLNKPPVTELWLVTEFGVFQLYFQIHAFPPWNRVFIFEFPCRICIIKMYLSITYNRILSFNDPSEFSFYLFRTIFLFTVICLINHPWKLPDIFNDCFTWHCCSLRRLVRHDFYWSPQYFLNIVQCIQFILQCCL